MQGYEMTYIDLGIYFYTFLTYVLLFGMISVAAVFIFFKDTRLMSLSLLIFLGIIVWSTDLGPAMLTLADGWWTQIQDGLMTFLRIN